MSNLPIACTLSTNDLAAVKMRYQAAASQYQSTARIYNGRADISLIGDKMALRDLLAEMIKRENRCCPFLTFTVTEHTTGYDIRLTVLDSSELDDGILRESVSTLFPGASMVDTASNLPRLQGAFAGPRPFPGRDVKREAAVHEAVRESLDLREA